MSKLVIPFLMALMFSFIAAIPPVSAEQGKVFSDVSKDHWAFEAISWGIKQNVLDGFPDGTFSPGKPVTEAEFLKILISSYSSLSGKGGNWYDEYYAFAQEKNWFVKGLSDKTAVDQPIPRRNAAIILSSALGTYYHDDSDGSTASAINELYLKGLSSGKTGKTIEGFMPDDTLTRAEAIQFIYHFVSKSGLTSLLTVISNTDWAALEKVTFTDQKGVLAKHMLFAKKYGLRVQTYEQAGTTYVHLVSNSESSTEANKVPFHYSSSYKIADDGTLSWDLITNVNVADPTAAYDLLAAMFSYDTSISDNISQNLVMFVKDKGYKIEGQISTILGKLEVITNYDQESKQYYISSKLMV
jgi:hypothetical protein